MGGILILGAIFTSTLLWADLSNKYVWATLFVVGSLGVVGFIDDYRKVIRKDPKGLIAKWKYFWQSVIALVVASALYFTSQQGSETSLVVPFFKDVLPQLGLFYITCTFFFILITPSAVSITHLLLRFVDLTTIFVVATPFKIT